MDLCGAPGPAASFSLPSHSPEALSRPRSSHISQCWLLPLLSASPLTPCTGTPWRPPQDSLISSPPRRMISYKADPVKPLLWALHLQLPRSFPAPPVCMACAWLSKVILLPGAPPASGLQPHGPLFFWWAGLVPTPGPLHLLFSLPRALPFIWF